MNRIPCFYLSFIALLLCLQNARISPINVEASNGFPVHNLNTGVNYTTIQEAIDSSETLDGHVIQVDSGTYYEHIVVNKSIQLIGENKHNTIINGDGSGTVITITADSTSVANFTIMGGGALHEAGILLDKCCNSLIINNMIRENGGDAIYLSEARENLVRENTITRNKFGIFAWRSSCYNNVTENIITDNEVNIYFVYAASSNNIKQNTLTNGDIGIYAFYLCYYNEIGENLIENNTIGIKFMDGCNDNRVYHNNFISNTQQALIEPEEKISKGIWPSVNTWDDGYPSGGNYWSDCVEVDFYSGLYQNESGSDTICDSCYIIDDDNKDDYPLMYRWRIINVPLEYPTIQVAINAANPGDTIRVLNGTYYEHITVNKSLSLIGENKHTTIIDGNATGSVVIVTADHVTISGFTIQRGGTIYPDLGDCLHLASDDNAIRQNILGNSAAGIYLPDCHSNIISQNIITNTLAYGIRMFRSTSNEIIENNITYAQIYGIFVAQSSECELRKNFLVNNQGGIYMGYCSNNNIAENVIDNSSRGITLELSSCNNVKGNTMIDNLHGLFLGPMFGPHQAGTDGNVLVENNAVNNNMGIETILSNNNLIYRNNFVNNTSQFYSHLSTNLWDDGLEGNYWSGYSGVDLNHDGIGDTSHIIDEDNTDRYPLMGVFQSFNATSKFRVRTICNSTISEFQYNGTVISFNVSGKSSTTGFCRICIPIGLMNAPFRVYVNSTQVSYNLLQCSNETYSYLYFDYMHSTQEVIIIPEFQSFLILPLFMMAILMPVIACKRKHVKSLLR